MNTEETSVTEETEDTTVSETESGDEIALMAAGYVPEQEGDTYVIDLSRITIDLDTIEMFTPLVDEYFFSMEVEDVHKEEMAEFGIKLIDIDIRAEIGSGFKVKIFGSPEVIDNSNQYREVRCNIDIINQGEIADFQCENGNDYDHINRIDILVYNEGTISGGTYDCSVDNESGGVITGGNFTDQIFDNRGTIKGGNFSNSDITYNWESGVIESGTFSVGELYNFNQITGGDFRGISGIIWRSGSVTGGIFNEGANIPAESSYISWNNDAKAYTVHGNVTLNEPLELNEGETLIIDKGASLEENGLLNADNGTVLDNNHSHNEIDFNAWADNAKLPETAGSYYLTGDVVLSETWNVPTGITNLCLDGHKLEGAVNLINVSSGVTINIYDDKGGNIKSTSAHSIVINGGTVNLYGKETIEGGVESTNGTLNINDEVRISASVAVNGGSMSIKGGSITNNKNMVTISNNCEFVMENGQIYTELGVAVSVSSSKLTMNGGTIDGCDQAIKVDSKSILKVTGGTIKAAGNSIYNDGGTVEFGGNAQAIPRPGKPHSPAIVNKSGGTLTVTGGKIQGGNQNATYHNVGIDNQNGMLKISGNPEIKGGYSSGSIRLGSGQKITIPEKLEGSYTIEGNLGVFTDGASGNATKDTFTPTDTNHRVIENSKGELEIIEKHKHTIDGKEVEFEPWTSTDSLPTDSGSYYLMYDVHISNKYYTVDSDISLCLNGHTIRFEQQDNGRAWLYINGSNFNLYDDKGEGKIEKGMLQVDRGNVTIYGGTISDDILSVLSGNVTIKDGTFPRGCVIQGGNLTIDGGTIESSVQLDSNSSLTINNGIIKSEYGMAIDSAALVPDNVTITINGGTITGDTGIAVGYENKLTVTGGTISGNRKSISSSSDDFCLSGNAVINGDIYISFPITITDELTNENTYVIDTGSGVFATGDYAAPSAEKFKLTDELTAEGYHIVVTADGELAMAKSAITYDPGEGTGEGFTECDVKIISDKTFTRTGYTQVGWTEQLNGETIETTADGKFDKTSVTGTSYYFGDEITDDPIVKLYPIWMKNEIKLSPTEVNIKVDDKEQITAVILPETAVCDTITWSIAEGDDSEVISFTESENGKTLDITGKKEGSVTLTASTDDGETTAKVTVNVTRSNSEVTPTAATETVIYGEQLTLSAEVKKISRISLMSVGSDEVEFLIGEKSLGIAQVEDGTAALTVDVTKENFTIGENKIKAVYSGSVSLNGSESGEITVKVEQRTLTASIDGETTKVYDGTANPPEGAKIVLNTESIIKGDEVGVSGTLTFDGKDVGDRKINATDLTLNGKDSDYYKLEAESISTDGTITEADSDITLTASQEKLTYGDDITLTVNIARKTGNNGIALMSAAEPDQAVFTVNGVTVGSEEVTLTKDAGTAKIIIKATAENGFKAGENTVSVEYGGSGNLKSGTAEIIVNVEKKNITAKIFGKAEKAYDGTKNVTSDLSIIANGIEESDTLTLTAESYSYADKNVGDKIAVTAENVTVGGTNYDNYTYTIEPFTGTITQALITIPTQTFTYSGEKEFTNTINTNVNNEKIEVTFTTNNKNAGSYAYESGYTAEITDTNYKITAGEELKIAQKTINEIKWQEQTTFQYNEQPHSVTAEITDKVSGDDVYLTYEDSTKSDVGTYKTTITGLGGTDNGNYVLSEEVRNASQDWCILESKLSCEELPTAEDITYGESLDKSVISGGIVKNGNIEVTGNFKWQNGSICPAVSDSESTKYEAVFTPADDNYKPITVELTVKVNKKRLVPSVGEVESKTYDGTVEAVGTILLEGAVLEDEPTATAEFAFTDPNAGMGKSVNVEKIEIGSWSANYELSADNLENQLTDAEITPLPAEFTWSNGTFTYDGTEKTVTAQVKNKVDNDTFTLEYEYNTATDKGSYTAKVTSLGNDNYTLYGAKDAEFDWSIDAKSITEAEITVSDITYNGSELTPTVKVILDGKTLNENTDYTLKYSGEVKNAGEYTVTAEGNGNYTGSASKKFAVSQKTVTPSITGDVNKVYDGKTTAPADVQIKLDGVLTGDDVTASGIFSYDSANAGKRTLTAENIVLLGEQADNYKLSADILTIDAEIAPLPAEFTWSNGTFTYDSTEKTVTAEVANKIGTDTFTLEYENNTATDKGSYTAKVTSLGNDNYTLDGALDVSFDWTIAAADSDITLTASQNELTYGDDITLTVNIARKTGNNGIALMSAAEPDQAVFTINGVTVGSEEVTLTKDAGTAKIIIKATAENGFKAGENTVSVEYGGSGNLKSGTAEIIVNVDPKKISAEVSGELFKTYDGTVDITGLTLKPTNVENDDNVEIEVKNFTFDNANAGDNKIITANSAALTGEHSGNYTLELPEIKGTIKKASLTIPARTFTYSGEKEFTNTIDTNVNNEKIEVTFKTNNKNAGSYAYESGYTAEITDTNYKITAGEELKIAQKTINEIKWQEQTTFQYNGQPHSVTAEITDKVSGDDVYLTYKDSTKSDVGTYTTTITGLGGTDNGNYVLSEEVRNASQDWSILESKLSCEELPTAEDITYGESLDKSVISGGIVKNGNIEVTGNFKWQNGSICPAVSDSESTKYEAVFTPADDNYKPITVELTVKVNKKLLVPSVGEVESKTYDGTTEAVGTILLEGAVLEDEPTATAEFAFTDPNVGMGKSVNVEKIEIGSWSANYELSADNLENQLTDAEITPLPAEFTWSNGTFTYDGIEKTVTAQVKNKIDNDTFTLEYEENTATDKGSYKAKVTSLGNYNYTLDGAENATFNWSIGAKSIAEAEISIEQLTYNGNVLIPQVTVTLDSKTLSEGTDYTLSYSDEVKNAGKYTVTATGTGNYTSLTGAEFTVTQKTVMPSVSGNVNKVYDGKATVPADVQIVLDGVVSDDDVTASGTFFYDSANAGKRTLTAKNIVLSGEQADNYKLSANTLTANAGITPLPAVLKWTESEFVYDGKEHSVNASVTNLIGSDVCDVIVEGSKAVNAGEYSASAKSLNNGNYTLEEAQNAELSWHILPAENAAPIVTIDFGKETLSTDVTMEFSSDGENLFLCAENMSVQNVGWDGSKSTTVQFRYAADENHKAGEVLYLTIPARPDAPDISGIAVTKTQESISIETISGYEYSINGTTWQENGQFGGLTADREYTVLIRKKASASNFASFAAKKTIVTSATVAGTTELLPGETVKTEDGNITNNGDDLVIEDKNGNRTAVTLPEGTSGGVTVDDSGNIVVPGGSLVETGSTTVTLPEGGTVSVDGTVVSDKVITENAVVSGENVTVNPDGEIVLPGSGEVQIGDRTVTLPSGGTVSADGTVVSDKVITENTVVSGENVTVNPDGEVVLPGSGEVQIGDRTVTLPSGGTVSSDGTIVSDKVITENAAVSGENVTVNPDGEVVLPGSGEVQIGDRTVTLPSGGKVTADGMVVSDNVITENDVVSGENVTVDPDGEIVLPGSGEVQIGDRTVTLPSGGTVSVDGTVVSDKVITENAAVSGENVTVNPDGEIVLSGSGEVQIGDRTVTLPSGGTVSVDGTVVSDKVITENTVVSGENVTVNPDGEVVLPGSGEVQIGDRTVTLPSGGTVSVDGTIVSDKVITENAAVSGENVTVDPDGEIVLPGSGEVQIGDRTVTLPSGGTVSVDGTVVSDKVITENAAVSGENVTVDPDGEIVLPEGGMVESIGGSEKVVTADAHIDTKGIITADGIVEPVNSSKITYSGHDSFVVLHVENVDGVLSSTEKSLFEEQIGAEIMEDYEITLLFNGVTEVQPDDAIRVTVAVPAGLDGAGIEIFRREEDGSFTDMNAVYDSQTNTLSFVTVHLSIYVFAKVTDQPVQPPTPVNPAEEPFRRNGDIPPFTESEEFGAGAGMTTKNDKEIGGEVSENNAFHHPAIYMIVMFVLAAAVMTGRKRQK